MRAVMLLFAGLLLVGRGLEAQSSVWVDNFSALKEYDSSLHSLYVYLSDDEIEVVHEYRASILAKSNLLVPTTVTKFLDEEESNFRRGVDSILSVDGAEGSKDAILRALKLRQAFRAYTTNQHAKTNQKREVIVQEVIVQIEKRLFELFDDGELKPKSEFGLAVKRVVRTIVKTKAVLLVYGSQHDKAGTEVSMLLAQLEDLMKFENEDAETPSKVQSATIREIKLLKITLESIRFL